MNEGVRVVHGGLEKSLELLAHTRNEAAVGILIPALDSALSSVQEGALRTLLERRSPAGHRELLARWHRLSERWKDIVAERPGRISSALRDAILGGDALMRANGCAAAIWLREYDLVPALINAAEDNSGGEAPLAAETLLELAQLLYDELAAPRDYNRRRDPQLVRRHVVSSLELSLKRYSRHQRDEVLEAFLLLARQDNSTLKKILQDPLNDCFAPLVRLLKTSGRPGVMRLVLSYLDDARAPSATIGVIAHRSDGKFLTHLMKKIGFEPNVSARANLRRIDKIDWVRDQPSLLDDLDDAEQHAVVQMVAASGISRLEAFGVVRYLLERGKAGGRRAATAALSQFKGADANGLLLSALDDRDPQVQASAVSQLRDRGIPGAMSKLIEKIDSRHAAVSEAARQSLSEFSFPRFLAAFDMLDEDVRRTTGLLVKKIDPHAREALVEEMQAPARSRRLRGVAVTAAIDMVVEVEAEVIALLDDEDHLVRAAAATALSQCDAAPAVRQALREAMLDRSVTVQEAAESSLQALAAGSGRQVERTRPSDPVPGEVADLLGSKTRPAEWENVT